MKTLSHENAYQVLLLQLGDEGRDKVLLGDSAARARESVHHHEIDRM